MKRKLPIMPLRLLHLILTLTLIAVMLPPVASPPVPARALTPDQQVERLLAEMTLEAKVGQLFMINLYGTTLTERGAAFIAEMHPGAVTLFDYNTDQQSAAQVATLINQMQAAATQSGAGIPLIIAVDQEGGRVRRLVNDITYLPDPIFMGAMTESASVQRIGALVGAELHAQGIHMNLAPVADLMVREDMLDHYSVVNRRTFGDDPARVGWQTAAYIAGMGQHNVIGVLKHYPGHGGAADSHQGLPQIDTDAATVRQQVMRPFEIAIEQGAPAVMVGHLYYSQIEPQAGLPATLSPTLIGILREDYGFNGVIMTDAMDMDAITEQYGVPEAALMAVQAGVDMIVTGPHLSPETQRRAMQRIIEAVHNGDLSHDQLNASVRRILTLKAAYGILDWTPLDPAAVTAQIDLDAAQHTLFEAYQDAATLVRDNRDLIPLLPGADLAIVYPAPLRMRDFCVTYAPDAHYYGYFSQPADADYNVVRRLGHQYDRIVIFVEDAILNPRQRDLITVLPPDQTVVVTMGLPFDLEVAGEVSGFLVMYHSLIAAREAACSVLFGAHPAAGRLPVAAGGYPSGSGLDD